MGVNSALVHEHGPDLFPTQVWIHVIFDVTNVQEDLGVFQDVVVHVLNSILLIHYCSSALHL